MRITFVSPTPNLSGGIRVIATYADHLTRRGHDVLVIAPSSAPQGFRTRLKSIARGKWPRMESQQSHFDGMKAQLRRVHYDGLLNDADVPDADAVIATWWETAFTVAHLPPSKGKKFYFVQGHENWGHLPQHLSMGSYFLPLKKITVAKWLVDVMRTQYGDASAALVPNSVDHDLFFASERRRQQAPTVGLMYSTAPVKGVDVSLRAIEIARRSIPDLRVVAFGADAVSRTLPLPDGTEYVHRPSKQRLRELYASCDVWLVGSRSEGFGLTILEAMACRCPVVATRTGCAPDFIQDGVNGFVADVEDAASLGRRLVDVLTLDEAGWHAMSEASRGSIAQYTWDDATTLFERALLEAN